MSEDNITLRKTLRNILLITIFCIVSYVYRIEETVDSILWLFAFMFSFMSVLETHSYFKRRRERDPSRSRGRSYRFDLFGVVLWAIGIYILGIIHFALQTSEWLIDISVFAGSPLFPLLGFGWMWVIEKFKDPFKFLARYISVLMIVSASLFLAVTTIVSGRRATLLELAVSSPLNYREVYLYMLIAVTLIVLYSTRGGRSRWGARSSGILAFINIILFFYILGWKLDDIDMLGNSLGVVSFFFA